jgi:hypothetical protein
MKVYFVVYLYKGTIAHTTVEAACRADVIDIIKADDVQVFIQSITVVEVK